MTNDECFFDTDCISAFLWVKREDMLVNLISGQIILPNAVYAELNHPNLPSFFKEHLENLCDNKIKVQNIEIGSEEYKIYHELAITPPKGKQLIGKGEAAAIAMAKVYGGVIASNNLKDIMPYIKEYNLKHITTGDILIKALNENQITEDEGNDIWIKMKNKRRKLPTDTFTQFIEQYRKKS